MAIDKVDFDTNLLSDESQPQYYFVGDSEDSILISNNQLLFLGEYSREGTDLHITHGNKSVVIDEYFGQQQSPDLVAENGATLTHDVVSALAAQDGSSRSCVLSPCLLIKCRCQQLFVAW